LPDKSFSYIFREHTIEHFSFVQGQQILNECFRVLKKGGKVRFSTPNLKFLVDLYTEPMTDVQKKYIKWVAKEFATSVPYISDTFVINNFVRAWGHLFIYDFKSLRVALKLTGFSSIVECKSGQSSDKNFLGLDSHSKVIGEDFNLLETLVIEAKKA